MSARHRPFLRPGERRRCCLSRKIGTGLRYINRESKDAIRSAVNELERAGYIERRQTTGASGKFSSGEYIIHESPVALPPSLDKP